MFLFNTCYSQLYTSDMQLDESIPQSYNSHLSIEVNQKKGLMIITDLETEETTKSKIKYLKVEKDEDGTIHWYSLIDNPKYNTLRIRRWAKPIDTRGKVHDTMIILSSYNGNKRVFDFGIFANRLNTDCQL